jgi:GGDEF domain-containing protein
VLPETGAADAALVGERICELLAKDVEEPVLSVSVGVAAYPGDAESVGPLLYSADAALYEMKGKRIRVVSDGPTRQVSTKAKQLEVSKSAIQANGNL